MPDRRHHRGQNRTGMLSTSHELTLAIAFLNQGAYRKDTTAFHINAIHTASSLEATGSFIHATQSTHHRRRVSCTVHRVSCTVNILDGR